ncbi:GNAT family N-acetyltransferase [Caldivirga sp.]|uniref:GNAT family N-acetyltransferase n=1 Tax=Caldivirga sp. TaxID=2080243 RepID=UPI0025C4A019|nr:GNAT family N-acetyltransferase [Caldivirga sp.]
MISIREFRDGDEVECSRVLKRAFEWYMKLPGSQWLEKKLSPENVRKSALDGITMVAVEGDSIVGCVNFTISDYNAAYVSIIGVLPEYSRRGIGSLLLEETERLCSERGVRKIWLMVSHINHAAILFYLKHNYEIAGFLKNMTLNGVHEVIMAKDLR